MTLRSTSRGITLLELLVVVAILLIVGTLTFAALHRSRRQGAMAQCVSNLRVLAEANLRFAADNGGAFCISMTRDNKTRWHGERESITSPFDPQKGPLGPYLGREGRVKICPSFSDALKGMETFEEGSGGYGYNAMYLGGTVRNRWEPEMLANIAQPATTVMFADTAMARSSGLQEYPFAEPWRWSTASGRLQDYLTPSVHFRHEGHAHVAWCDGHVSAEKPSELGRGTPYGGDCTKYKIGWFGPKEENGYWNPFRKTR